jgi:glutamate N-acetyltransferase/amino-acid N-acetyltransferase
VNKQKVNQSRQVFPVLWGVAGFVIGQVEINAIFIGTGFTMEISMELKRSPLAPTGFPDLPEISGIEIHVARAGYRDWNRCDLTYVMLAENSTVAGVTTQSKCPSPEVEWCREALFGGRARGLIVNAGNANAFTGSRGREAVSEIVSKVAMHVSSNDKAIFVASTGVIGEPLPIEKAMAGLDAAFSSAAVSWEQAADAISTTDTFPKGASSSALIDGKRVTIAGIAKGSGMIAPDMATMLGFLFTDAAASSEFLQQALNTAVASSFNCITVDSDTSTSDTVLLFATGEQGNKRLESFTDAGADAFVAALKEVCLSLAHQVVRDGEGAAKFIEITVEGAESDESARTIALAVANSPLVKTAIAGEDANWGRIVMAVGKAGEKADRDKLSISFGATQVAEAGVAKSGYDETPVAAHLQGDEIQIGIGLGIGKGAATVWTCDLTHGYISINADYRS